MTSRHKILSKGLRRKRGEMNKTEAEYSKVLDADPEVFQWWYEKFTLRYSCPEKGQPGTYTPDFLVLRIDGRTYIDDVKANKRFDDKASGVRIKACAEQFPLWIFRRVWKLPKKQGGGWEIKEE